MQAINESRALLSNFATNERLEQALAEINRKIAQQAAIARVAQQEEERKQNQAAQEEARAQYTEASK